jgi:FlaA1/EpsC-like NDP-sugar epimerase
MVTLRDKNILITGGTGSLGRSLVNYLVKNQKCKKIIVLSRDEHKQFKMRLEYPQENFPQLEFHIADIRDYERLNQLFKNVDVIFHLAALKHVHTSEQNPLECIKTNIIGSENVIRAAINQKVKKVVALSSDKAVSPHNIYGATKFCADKLFVYAQKETQDTIFSVLRLGNVVYSRGSVFEIFQQQKSKSVLYVSHAQATRFIVTMEQSINWLLFALENSHGGEIYVPRLRSFKVSHLAKVIAPSARICVTGLKIGEKLHEQLITETDSYTTAEFSNYFVIYPDHASLKKSKGSPLPFGYVYISSNKRILLNLEQLRKIIKSQKFNLESL